MSQTTVSAVTLNRPLGHCREDPPAHGCGVFERDAKHDGKLLATCAADVAVYPGGVAHALGHLTQDRISGRMPERIVDALEVVDVDDRERKRVRTLNFVEPRPTVEHSRERIETGQTFGLFAQDIHRHRLFFEQPRVLLKIGKQLFPHLRRFDWALTSRAMV